MAKKTSIIAIGDWSIEPHHALPKVDRKSRPRPTRPKQSKAKPLMNLEQESPPENQRLCACGTPLGFRRRFCDKCKARRRKESNRKAQRKYNKKKRSNISN